MRYKKVAICLESLIDDISSIETSLPDKPKKDFWMKFLLDIHESIVYKG